MVERLRMERKQSVRRRIRGRERWVLLSSGEVCVAQTKRWRDFRNQGKRSSEARSSFNHRGLLVLADARIRNKGIGRVGKPG